MKLHRSDMFIETKIERRSRSVGAACRVWWILPCGHAAPTELGPSIITRFFSLTPCFSKVTAEDKQRSNRLNGFQVADANPRENGEMHSKTAAHCPAFASLLLSFFWPVLIASAADWVNISEPVTSQVKPGYAG